MEIIKEREEKLLAAAKNKKKTGVQLALAKNLVAFGRTCIASMCTKPSPLFHYQLARYLMDVNRQLINLVAPRGHAKSSLVACVFVLWHIFLEDIWRYLVGNVPRYQRNAKFIVLISKTQGEAIRRLDTIKSVLGDENGRYEKAFRAIFGNWGYGTHRSWTKTEVVLKDGTILLAIGAGQQARGLKKVHQRPTLIVADDPEDEENTKTSDRMQQNMGWLIQAIIPSLDADMGRCVVIGTPQNHSCMVVNLHDAVGWTSAWFGNDLSTCTSTWDGENYDKPNLLWPELMGKEKLTEKMDMARSLGRLASYYREYETKVVGDEDQLFKPEYFREWDGQLQRDLVGGSYLEITHLSGQGNPLEKLKEPKQVAVHLFLGVDPASSTSRRADYTVCMIIGLDKEGNIYIVDYIRRRMPPAAVLQAVRNTHTTYKPVRGAVETTSAQEYIVDMLRSEGVFLIGRKPRTGKEERLVMLEPLFSQGKVFIKPTMQDFKREFMDFPRGKHDDIMDAFHIAHGCSYKPVGDPILSTEAAKKRSERKTYDYMLS